MRDSFYDRVSVTDGLAGERTFLAAERTLLAYVRTAFTWFAVGLTATELLTDPVLTLVGRALAILSAFVFVVGVIRYRRSRAATIRLLERLEAQSPSAPERR